MEGLNLPSPPLIPLIWECRMCLFQEGNLERGGNTPQGKINNFVLKIEFLNYLVYGYYQGYYKLYYYELIYRPRFIYIKNCRLAISCIKVDNKMKLKQLVSD